MKGDESAPESGLCRPLALPWTYLGLTPKIHASLLPDSLYIIFNTALFSILF